MDVLPRQKERRAVVPARKASSPGSVPPSFMPASGILQQQLKKMSLGVGEAVAARAPPAFCRRGTPGRGGHTPGARREHTEPPLRKLHSPERSPEQHFRRLRSGFLRRARRRATPRRPAAARWNRLELAVVSAYVRRPVTPRSGQPAPNFTGLLRPDSDLGLTTNCVGSYQLWYSKA